MKDKEADTHESLSHIDAQGRPAMVDVSGKEVTGRIASARAVVTFPPGVTIFGQDYFSPEEKTKRDESVVSCMAAPVSEIMSAKGPVFATAIIAGTQAAKATSQLIPFCHTIALEDCKIACVMVSPSVIGITCTVKSRGRTGVEMEALTGVTIAALTIYDMCKALSHEIVVGPIELVAKSGGKSDFAKAN